MGKILLLISCFIFPCTIYAAVSANNEENCKVVIQDLNTWSKKHGYGYAYKLKDVDTIEVSTINAAWCRIIALKNSKKLGEVSYTLRSKNPRAASEIDAYFNNSVEHAQIFPLVVNDWCRGVGCSRNK